MAEWPRPLIPYRSEIDRNGARTVALAVPPERMPEDGDRRVPVIGPIIAETIAAARSADAVHRKLPFTCRMDGRLVTGRIDLAYRTDGAWTVIDFKTARLSDSAQAAERYREQMDRYRTALSALTGESVAAALCLVRTGDLVSI